MSRLFLAWTAALGLCLSLFASVNARADDLLAAIANDVWLQRPHHFDGGVQLRQVVLLMRHGVRPPTNTSKFQPYASSPFPTQQDWGAPDGNLTPNGATRITTFGSFERRLYSVQGLISRFGCPAPGDLFVWADNSDERTRATGLALLQGLYPGCSYPNYYSSSSSDDLLFSPNFPLDTTAAQAAVLTRMGGGFAPLQASVKPLLTEMGQVLGCCSVTLCQQQVGVASCSFPDLPWSFSASANSLSFNGALATGSSIAEIFQLEYENGFTGGNVAFGKASSPEAVRKLMAAYTTKYYYFDRTPILARTNGSDIAQQILYAIQQGAGQKTAGGPPAGKLTIYVGHDGTIAALAGMLDLDWTLRTYQKDDMPAGGALGFELFSVGAGRQTAYFVRPIYLTATLEQTHFNAPLSALNPPIYESLHLNGCTFEQGRLCTLDEFVKIMKGAIDPNSTAPESYN